MSSSDIFFGELLGTAVLILLGGGVVAAVVLKKSKAFGAGWVAITLGWGLAVLSGAYVSAQLSGAHLNPAVTLGIAIDTGEWGDVGTYLAGQMLGAMLGAVLVWLAYYGHFQAHLADREIVGGSDTPGPPAVDDPRRAEERPVADGRGPGPVLGVFSTAPEIRNAVQNLTTEILGTAVLVLLILGIGLNEGLALSGTGTLMVALVVVGIGLSLGGPTGYAINPARDLGPRIVHALLPLPNKGGSDWSYAWVPVVGPLIGGALAGGIHNALF
ncbi:MIP/aquaporin family protein [Streptomyces sp. DSM 44917]|uniref:MIP/aquaporin family protein n=1 Tax=Streptomyces boetiae TaxID=3075541 RepID=A0ABU2L309_9ACTN|nr:MIP/aquaporin family protein [Streptomyces sp. DSM 44917]MDT0305949.1 MIP/aquaporin family protein [Streptomyces sp. DSM 44917]